MPEREALTFRLHKAIETVQENIHVIASWKVFVQTLFTLAELLQKASLSIGGSTS